MAKEIERKFLVVNDDYVKMSIKSTAIIQGYISTDPEATVRVRITDDNAYITIKSRNQGSVRDEWEYPIPVIEANDMLHRLCGNNVIEKTRHIVPFDGNTWEIDVFGGSLNGLIIAEIELPDPDCIISLPSFVGTEVTSDTRYYNSSLSQRL